MKRMKIIVAKTSIVGRELLFPVDLQIQVRIIEIARNTVSTDRERYRLSKPPTSPK